MRFPAGKWKSADGTVGYWTHNGKIEANVEVFRSPETLKSCFFVNGGGKKKKILKWQDIENLVLWMH